MLSAQERRSAGLVESIHGTVMLREPGQAETVVLDPEADLGRRLYPGELLLCKARSNARLRIAGQPTLITPGAGWFTIPHVRLPPTDPRQKLLDAYARLGGRNRDVGMWSRSVFSPADHGTFQPRAPVIRWTPAGCNFSIAIRAHRRVVWRLDNVRDTGGSLQSAELRNALTTYRDESGEGPLTLELHDACGGAATLTFRLLSDEEEDNLAHDLAAWATEQDLLVRHLGMASAYDDAGLFPEAAQQYEEALARAPKSRDLLLRTLAEQSLTGNVARATELETRAHASAK